MVDQVILPVSTAIDLLVVYEPAAKPAAATVIVLVVAILLTVPKLTNCKVAVVVLA